MQKYAPERKNRFVTAGPDDTIQRPANQAEDSDGDAMIVEDNPQPSRDCRPDGNPVDGMGQGKGEDGGGVAERRVRRPRGKRAKVVQDISGEEVGVHLAS